MKKYLEAFVVGLAFPATLLSIVYTFAYLLDFPPVLNYPLQFIPLWVPWVFGAWNMFNLYLKNMIPIKQRTNRYWFLGILLGFFVAIFGITILELPVILFQLTGTGQLFPLIFVPLVYGLIWRYVILPLNNVFKIRA